jgi:hypothetical protein
LLCPGEACESAAPRVAQQFLVRAAVRMPPREGGFADLGQRAER